MNATPNHCLRQNRLSEEEKEVGFKTAIQKVKCDKSVAPISNYLQSVSNGSQLVNHSVIQELRFFVQDCHVTVVITAGGIEESIYPMQLAAQMNEYTIRTKSAVLFLEYIKTVSCESEKWDAIALELVKLCTLCFLNSLLANKNGVANQEELINIIHIVSDLMNVSPQVLVGITQVFSSVLLKTLVEENLSFTIRKSFLSMLSRTVTMSTTQAQRVILCSHKPELRKLSDFMVTCGDYELQSAILAIVLQLLVAVGKENDISQSLFPSYPAISDAFVLHSFENLRSELRQFLNKVNSLSEKKLVYSVPCLAVFLDNKELKKPDEYTEFWIDVCILSKCVYINHQEDTARPYNLICISEKDVSQIVAVEYSFIVNSKPVQCIRLVTRLSDNNLLKIYFPKTELFSCLKKDALIPLFGTKYQDGSVADTGNTLLTEMNVTVQNDSPDEVDSPPLQTRSNQKNKSKLIKSIYRNCNKNNSSTGSIATGNTDKRPRLLETENNDDLSIDPNIGLIRRRKSKFSENNLCVNKEDNSNNKSGTNNNNTVCNDKETKEDNDFINIMPTVTKKRQSNKIVVNGKFSPVNVSVHSKGTKSNKAENSGVTLRNSLLERRKLYSFQNEDVTFSSVEEYTASLPNCYKVNRGKNNLNTKVTYSYRANGSVENKIQKQDTLFSDMLESRYKIRSLSGTPVHFPMKMAIPKNNKLKKQQMPIEMDVDSADENKFFKSNKFASAVPVWKRTPIKKSKKSEKTKSVYSDLSSSESGIISVKVPLHTYSRKPIFRQKRKKSKNRKIERIDSDTDSEYKPLSSDINTKPVQCTRQRHRRSCVVALINKEPEEDRLRDCKDAECSEELPLNSYMNISNEAVTEKDTHSPPMPLLPEIATNIGNDETILLKFTPEKKNKSNFKEQDNSVQEESRISADGPVLRRRKYIRVKSKNISKKKNVKLSEESSALSKPNKVTTSNCQEDIRVNNIEIENEKNSAGSSQHKNASPKSTSGVIYQNASNFQKTTEVNKVEVERRKRFNERDQCNNVSPKKKSGVIDRNTLFDDLTVYCAQQQKPPESNAAAVHETSVNNETDNSQSSLRSSVRIKDLTHKDELCRFGTALTKHMKRKLTSIQDDFKEERNVQNSELDTVLRRELKSVEKQKQKIMSVAKDMETCRKLLEGAFSVQMKTCEELEKSIGNINDGKQLFFKEAKKTEERQSSKIMENIRSFKQKMSQFVNTFVATDKKLMDKYCSQL